MVTMLLTHDCMQILVFADTGDQYLQNLDIQILGRKSFQKFKEQEQATFQTAGITPIANCDGLDLKNQSGRAG